MIDTTILAILQGIAEFLPISSSGHLTLGKALLGFEEPGLRLDIMLHVGTLVSIGVFYFSVIWRILMRCEWKYALKVVLSAIPVGVVGVILNDWLTAAFGSTRMVGVALLFTGTILVVTKFLPKGEREVGWWSALVMGIAQAIAILPGVSRSGMTIAAGRLAGVKGERCAEFSFLMSIPPIAGAALLEILKSTSSAAADATAEVSWPLAIYGALVAAVVGYFALKFLIRSLNGSRFWLFGVYCYLAGALAIVVG